MTRQPGDTEREPVGLLKAAALLHERRDEILRRWAERAIAEVPAARQQERTALIDNLPIVLGELSDALARMHSTQEIVLREQVLGTTHGLSRALMGEYDLDQVLHEYDLLRQVVLDVLDEHHALDRMVRGLVLETIHVGVRRAVTTFTRRREEDRVRHASEQEESLAREQRARQETEQRQLLLDLIIEQSADGIIVADEHGVIRLINREAERQHGVERRQVESPDWQPTFQILTVDHQPIPIEQSPLLRALRGEHVRDAAWLVKRPDGELRYLTGTASPLTRPDGSSAGAVVIIRDETERRRAEEAIHRSASELRTLAELVPQVVWTADPAGRIDYINPAFARYTGISEEKSLGSGWMAAIHPDDIAVTSEKWSAAARQGEPYEVEHRLRQVGNGYRWMLSRAHPLKDDQGEVVKWFGTSTDIEGLKQAEADAERRAQFEQQLVGIVSHDLRNPISAILLGCQALLRRTDLGERHIQSLVRIQSAADRAHRMVRDLLDFTRVRLGGGLPIRREPLDVHTLATQVVDELLLVYPDRTITLSHLGDGHGEWDADRIAQVFTNLISNAVAYSPADTPIRVTLGDRGPQLEIRVHNEGEPIAPELMPKLFEPLERGTQTESGSRNIGLGLFIVKHIVQAHGGTIELHSAADAGTVFIVRLPRH